MGARKRRIIETSLSLDLQAETIWGPPYLTKRTQMFVVR